MEIIISEELTVFLSTVLAGISIGIIYDLFRVIRSRVPVKGLFRDIQDIVFWLVATGIVFFVVFTTNNGRMRSYELLGVILGAVLYIFVLSRLLSRLLNLILDILIKIFLFCFKILLTPLLFLYNIISKPLLYIGGKLSKVSRKLHKKVCRFFASGYKQIKIKRTKK